MAQLASKIDISQPSLSKIENGTHEVSITILENICHDCKITMVDFFRMLSEDVDLEFDLIEDEYQHSSKVLETELIEVVKTLTTEQQKVLYVLLMPYVKQ